MKVIDAKNLLFEKAAHGDYTKQVILKDGETPNIHQLGRVLMKKGEIAGDHGHSGQTEIILIEQGKAKVIFNGNREVTVNAGQVFVTEGHETHEISNPFDEDLVLLFLEVYS